MTDALGQSALALCIGTLCGIAAVLCAGSMEGCAAPGRIGLAPERSMKGNAIVTVIIGDDETRALVEQLQSELAMCRESLDPVIAPDG